MGNNSSRRSSGVWRSTTYCLELRWEIRLATYQEPPARDPTPEPIRSPPHLEHTTIDDYQLEVIEPLRLRRRRRMLSMEEGELDEDKSIVMPILPSSTAQSIPLSSPSPKRRLSLPWPWSHLDEWPFILSFILLLFSMFWTLFKFHIFDILYALDDGWWLVLSSYISFLHINTFSLLFLSFHWTLGIILICKENITWT